MVIAVLAGTSTIGSALRGGPGTGRSGTRLAAAAAIPARVLAQCTGSGCDGKWPGEQQCVADEKEAFSDTTGSFSVAVFYSPSCHAIWAEFHISVPNPNEYFQFWAQPQYGGEKYRPLSTGGPANVNVAPVAGATNVIRSVLVNADYAVKACWGYKASPTYPDPVSDPQPDPNVIPPASAGGCSPWL